MTRMLTPNTKAILMLTAPLIAGRDSRSAPLLTPSEYKRLARQLREMQQQPADLVAPNASALIQACGAVIDTDRLNLLLDRGFQLSQVLEHWHARAIRVISRADAEYPRRLKGRLREDAPAVLYVCGNTAVLDNGGLAVVGSRDVDDDLLAYTRDVGALAARAGRMVVSGGARGVDQAAMRGALEAGGRVCGVMPDSLEKAAMNRDNRDMILAGQLVLISPYDPKAGFNAGNAMQRNKLIYALADTSLVVNSDLKKGGTWAGAVEQLDKFRFVPVFVRSTGQHSAGLDALRTKGAMPWPNPADVEAFEAMMKMGHDGANEVAQGGLVLAMPAAPALTESARDPATARARSDDGDPTPTVDPMPPAIEPMPATVEPMPAMPQERATDGGQPTTSLHQHTNPAATLFAAAQTAIQQVLRTPQKDDEVATALDISAAQAKAWLQRLVDEGKVTKLTRPVRYVATGQPSLFAGTATGPSESAQGQPKQ